MDKFCRFVFVCFTTNFMNKLKFNVFLFKLKKIHLTEQIFHILQNHPTFHLDVGQHRKRKRVLFWSIYIISL